MPSGVWNTAVTVLIAILSSGTVVAIINWISKRGINQAEAENIWDQIKSRNFAEANEELKAVKCQLATCEYKIDRMADGWSSTISRLEKCTGEDMSDIRRELIDIKYLRAIPGSDATGDQTPPATE